ncbi:MAG TPA: hypothetical protein HPP83_13295 [Candidatus Hydrogenedentes bacterium]|nr:hypothetical protein [Candidatus Hydrogenedentota bacterium]
MNVSPERLYQTLTAHREAPLLPELAALSLADLRRTPAGEQALAWAADHANEVPQTTYTLYREYLHTGARGGYQQVCFGKRELLRKLAMAVWLGEDSRKLDLLCDVIWSICEETTWVLPAHEVFVWNVDLTAAETASDLALVVHVLDERLPLEIRNRVQTEVRKRIFDNYMEHAGLFGYETQPTNWTGVCMGSIGEAALVLESDPRRQAAILAKVIEQLQNYLENGFAEDGACTEGVGYWNYGLLHFVACAEMLRSRADGAIDLLDHPKLKSIARFPLAMWLGGQNYATFSDAGAVKLLPHVTTRIAQRTDTPELIALAQPSPGSRFVVALLDLLWPMPPEPDLPDLSGPAYYAAAGIARCVSRLDGLPIILIGKAGHNAEPHNHNDVGSFVLHIGDTTYLCDPGAGRYTRDYFLPETRYDNLFCGSQGHSVPVADGLRQAPGPECRGAMTDVAEDHFTLRFEQAYPDDAHLARLERTMSLQPDGRVELRDVARFDGGSGGFREVFMTWRDVRTDGSKLHILGPEGQLCLDTGSGRVEVEDLRDACEANGRSETLMRVTVDYPPATEHIVKTTIAFTPKGNSA